MRLRFALHDPDGSSPARKTWMAARGPKTVEKEINPLYYRLIDEFGKHTGVRVVMNTTFNLRGEAVVHTPTDALRTFFSSGMDALFLGSFLVEK
jgi:carbamoyltransferase